MLDITREDISFAYEKFAGNTTQAAKSLGMSRSTFWNRIKSYGLLDKPVANGRISSIKEEKRSLPAKGGIKRYILTSAQNNTYVNEKVWTNIVALAEYYNAELMVGTFSYNQNAYGEMSVKQGKKKQEEKSLWFDPNIHPFISDNRILIAPALCWCGEMNIMPTAMDPLVGFETYTQRSSGIFPASKMAMRSIASGTQNEPTKFNYSTGCVTKRNYIQKRAGLKAEHHHSYGGLVVEVNHLGEWWVRQLGASKLSGDIYDIGICVRDGSVTQTKSVAAITWGDIHELMLCPDVEEASWGKGGIMDTLKPKKQFIHDVMLGSVTNHWESKNPHSRFRSYAKGGGFSSIDKEFSCAVDFLHRINRKFCKTLVVDSNHDRPWIERWLQDSAGQNSPRNAITWHTLNAACLQAIEDDPEDRTKFHLLEHALKRAGLNDDVVFLRQDESHTICNGKIECGLHGHLGPNGSRGGPRNLSKLGRRANVGHYHSAGIWDGLFAAGTSCKADLGYNAGPSSWSNSHIVTYPNGKRSILTIWKGKWRA